jgi:hypothetical protein
VVNEGKDHLIGGYVDASLDPRIEARIREIATIQSKITALEIINQDIKPELKALREPKWGPSAVWVGAFLTFMVGYGAIERSMQSAESQSNQVRIEHNADSIKHTYAHLIALEQNIKELRDYIDDRDNQMRSIVYTKEEHNIFDKERFAKLQEIENRLMWIEHQCGKK